MKNLIIIASFCLLINVGCKSHKFGSSTKKEKGPMFVGHCDSNQGNSFLDLSKTGFFPINPTFPFPKVKSKAGSVYQIQVSDSISSDSGRYVNNYIAMLFGNEKEAMETKQKMLPVLTNCVYYDSAKQCFFDNPLGPRNSVVWGYGTKSAPSKKFLTKTQDVNDKRWYGYLPYEYHILLPVKLTGGQSGFQFVASVVDSSGQLSSKLVFIFGFDQATMDLFHGKTSGLILELRTAKLDPRLNIWVPASSSEEGAITMVWNIDTSGASYSPANTNIKNNNNTNTNTGTGNGSVKIGR